MASQRGKPKPRARSVEGIAAGSADDLSGRDRDAMKAIFERQKEEDGTRFLDVDLEIFSNVPLDPIAEAFGEKVSVLYVGKTEHRYSAHFELVYDPRRKAPDRIIRGLVRLVERLPKQARRLWDRATAREFNIGIEAAGRSPALELRLQPQTLAAVAAVDGRIVVTVYAPERLFRPVGAGRRGNAAR